MSIDSGIFWYKVNYNGTNPIWTKVAAHLKIPFCEGMDPIWHVLAHKPSVYGFLALAPPRFMGACVNTCRLDEQLQEFCITLLLNYQANKISRNLNLFLSNYRSFLKIE
jgi:hypothetical protein